MEVFFFLLFALLAVACAISLVVQTHPISSALSLVGVMGSLAALYLLLGGEFIAGAQLVVYAGAIMVLFVFVIMLLNTGGEPVGEKAIFAKWMGIPVFIGFVGLMTYIVWRDSAAHVTGVVFGSFTHGGAADVGRGVFFRYLYPFEITSVLILIAILGAVMLARKEIDE